MTMSPEALLFNVRVVGVFMAILVVVNLFVPGRLHWREEMARLSLVNRQIFEVHSIFIVLTLALVSALLLTSGDTLLQRTRLSRFSGHCGCSCSGSTIRPTSGEAIASTPWSITYSRERGFT
jgi:hypothetical protein